MDNLQSTNISLRTIELKEYSELITDLNHNFKQILSLPGFKGKKGLEGDSVTGATGIRGSLWVFAESSRFISAYAVISTAAQVNLAFMNAELLSDPAKLYDTLGFGDSEQLLDNDTVVLPAGMVIQLQTNIVDPSDPPNFLDPAFIDTGLSFAQQSGVTEDRVREIVSESIADPTDADSVLKSYSAIAKNVSDISGGANIEINNDSVLDINTTASGPGPTMPSTTYIGAKEVYVNASHAMCMISGSAIRYHELVQGTQETLNNNYAPGVDDLPGFVVLQNNYKSGILIGHKDETNFRKFGRIWRDSSHMVIASSYSPNSVDNSYIAIADNSMTTLVRGTYLLNSTFVDFRPSAEFRTRHFITRNSDLNVWLGFAGDNTQNVFVQAKNVYFSHQGVSSAQILSTDASGKLVKTYSIRSVWDATPLHSNVPTQALVRETFDSAFGFTSSVQTALNTHTALTSNPHSVTKSQVGLANTLNSAGSNSVSSTSTTVYAVLGGVKKAYDRGSLGVTNAAAAQSTANAVATALGTHAARTDDPHAVTKSQVGLSNVNNWVATTAVTDSSTTKYSTASAVRLAYNRGSLGVSNAAANKVDNTAVSGTTIMTATTPSPFLGSVGATVTVVNTSSVRKILHIIAEVDFEWDNTTNTSISYYVSHRLSTGSHNSTRRYSRHFIKGSSTTPRTFRKTLHYVITLDAGSSLKVGSWSDAVGGDNSDETYDLKASPTITAYFSS